MKRCQACGTIRAKLTKCIYKYMHKWHLCERCLQHSKNRQDDMQDYEDEK